MLKPVARTEQQLPDFRAIDTWADNDILLAMADGQARAIAAVRAAIPEIARAAGSLAANLGLGGRLFYAGAGTSIRVGVQDGSELPSTFGLAPERIGYLIAGGRAAMFDTMADAEDDMAEGAAAGAALVRHDTLIAIAASGATPFTVAAAKAARGQGATVIAVANNSGSPLAAAADIAIFLNSGPEVVAGSTRMGAGTAQKAALNMLSTLAHIRLGAVHDGMMVNVQAGNVKLQQRAREIVAAISGASPQAAAAALDAAHGEVKPAILICAGAGTIDHAQEILRGAQGNLRTALQSLAGPPAAKMFHHGKGE